MKENPNREEIDENFVKEFLTRPTESLLIPTDEIRFGKKITKLIFKEDHAVGEQQQNLLFFNSEWTIWMVCNLRGMESLLRWDYILKLVFFLPQLGCFSERQKRGREAFALKSMMAV